MMQGLIRGAISIAFLGVVLVAGLPEPPPSAPERLDRPSAHSIIQVPDRVNVIVADGTSPCGFRPSTWTPPEATDPVPLAGLVFVRRDAAGSLRRVVVPRALEAQVILQSTIVRRAYFGR